MALWASVIIPTYNRSGLLLRALDSVKNQSYSPIEVIVIDDGSTDDTEELVNEWIRRNSTECFRAYYFFKENGGPSTCRNFGIGRAKGSYIYFLDSDDYMHSNLLNDAIEVLEREKSDCVLFGFELEDEFGHISHYSPPELEAIESYLIGKLWGYTPSSLKRAELVHSIGPWNESIRIAEDYEYLGRSILNSRKTSVLHSQLLTVSRDDCSLGSQKDTEMGLVHRLNAEALVIGHLKARKQAISTELLAAYSSRLLKISINMYAKGEVEFARRLGRMALGIECGPKNIRDRCKWFVWRQGRWSCFAWYGLSRISSAINKFIVGYK